MVQFRCGFLVVLLLVSAPGCDRNIEPFVPGETVEAPDLSGIFPPGAERAARGEGQPLAAPGPAAGLRGGAASGSPIAGTITLAPELEGRVPGDSVAFLIARSGSEGPPLAARRIDSPQLPLDFEIGPQDVMIASTPFAGPIQLSVRIDADGNATTRSAGDLEGKADGPVEPGTRGVRIVIDTVL